MRLLRLAHALAAAAAATSAFAADIVLTPPAGGGVAVTNAAGTATQLRVADDGTSVSGNLNLQATTATAGVITRGLVPFIHGFGTHNTFIGQYAGNLAMTGTHNTGSGSFALASNASGAQNTASGNLALYYNGNGSRNTANGHQSQWSNTSGSNNTAIGWNSLVRSTSGWDNTAIGTLALAFNSTGTNNIGLGNMAGYSLTTGDNNVDIANPGVAGESNTIRIGTQGFHTNTYLAGNVGMDPAGVVSFGMTTRQMLNLWSTTFAIGVQDNTLYLRSGSSFSWFQGGTHSTPANTPGAGGAELMRLTSTALTVNGTFVSSSDRNAKENFAAVDSKSVLEKVASLPLQSWNYRTDESKVRHLGPMAQDFHAAFGVGPDDRHIATVDEGGVALAAIQGLNAKLEERDAVNAARIAELERDRGLKSARIAELERDRQAQMVRMDALERHAAKMIAAIDRLQRDGTVTAGLGLN